MFTPLPDSPSIQSCCLVLQWEGMDEHLKKIDTITTVTASIAEVKLEWNEMTTKITKDEIYDLKNNGILLNIDDNDSDVFEITSNKRIHFGYHTKDEKMIEKIIILKNTGTINLNCQIRLEINDDNMFTIELSDENKIHTTNNNNTSTNNSTRNILQCSIIKKKEQMIRIKWHIPSTAKEQEIKCQNLLIINSEADEIRIPLEAIQSYSKLQLIDASSIIDFGEIATGSTSRKIIRIRNIGKMCSSYTCQVTPPNLLTMGCNAKFVITSSNNEEMKKDTALIGGGKEVELTIEMKPIHDGEFDGNLLIQPNRFSSKKDGSNSGNNGMNLIISGNSNSNLLHFDILSRLNFNKIRINTKKTMKRRLINHCGMSCEYNITMKEKKTNANKNYKPIFTIEPIKGTLNSESSTEITFTMIIVDATNTTNITNGEVKENFENRNTVVPFSSAAAAAGDDMEDIFFEMEIKVMNLTMNNRIDSSIECIGGLGRPRMTATISNEEQSYTTITFPSSYNLGSTVVGGHCVKILQLRNVGTGTMFYNIELLNTGGKNINDDNIIQLLKVKKEKIEDTATRTQSQSIKLKEKEEHLYHILYKPKDEKKTNKSIVITTDALPTEWKCNIYGNGIKWLIIEEWPSIINFNNVSMNSLKHTKSFELRNGGPEPYPITFSIVEYNLKNESKEGRGNNNVNHMKDVVLDNTGWKILSPPTINIPSAPNSSKIIIAWSTIIEKDENKDENKNDRNEVPIQPPSKEDYLNQLHLYQSTPKIAHLKMIMTSGRIEYIKLLCNPVINTCRLYKININSKNNTETEVSMLSSNTLENDANSNQQENNSITFESCLISQYITKKVKIYNDTNYTVPYQIIFSSNVFRTDANINNGSIQPHSFAIITILFHPTDTYDSNKTSSYMYIELMYGYVSLQNDTTDTTVTKEKMKKYKVYFQCRTEEFLFNARLLGKIKFNYIYLGESRTKSLVLQNQQDKEVEYKLITNDMHTSMLLNVIEKKFEKIVPVNEKAHVQITFSPVKEGEILSVLNIHTIDGSYPIEIHGHGIPFEYLLTHNTNDDNVDDNVDKIDFGCIGYNFEKKEKIILFNSSNSPIKIKTHFHLSKEKKEKEGDDGEDLYKVEPSGTILIPASTKQEYTITFAPTMKNTHHNMHHKENGKRKNEKINLIFQGMPEYYSNENDHQMKNFIKHNPNSKKTLHLSGKGGNIDIDIQPKDSINFGTVSFKNFEIFLNVPILDQISLFLKHNTFFPSIF